MAGMLTEPITGSQAWRADDLSAADWQVSLSAACVSELRDVAAHLRARPLPTLLLSPDDYVLAACRDTMTRVRAILDDGVRFAVVGGLPIDEFTADEAKSLFWLLSSMIARPVAQKRNGTMIYDVLDTGLSPDPGTEIRPDKTNIEIAFHNDNGYGPWPPDYTCLLCLQTAKAGPQSLVMSVDTLHNELLARYPETLPRLYEPFWFDRAAENAADEPPFHAVPVFDFDERLKVRLAMHQMHNGYKLRSETMDDAGAQAVAALRDVFADRSLAAEFYLERGQMQFLNNRSAIHSRTAFEDHADPAKRRHLVRLWLRDQGDRSYPG